MLDRTTKTLAPEYFGYLLELEGNLAVRHLYYLSLLDFEFDSPRDDGHLAVLVHHIRSGLRKTDLIGRMSPFRFCIALQYTEIHDAWRIARRIQKRVKKHPLCSKGNKRTGAFSMGGACFPTHASSIQKLPKVAEQMLYDAKKDGGNRIYFPSD